MNVSCPPLSAPQACQNRSPAQTAAGGWRQRGQGAVEFLLAATPVLLIGLSSIEAIHWYFARQAVSLALVQAARAAITQHADPVVLDHAFAEALLPMYTGPSQATSRARLQRAVARRERDTGLPAWRIRMLSPSSASFEDFASLNPDLPKVGKPVIDNDYLLEQHQQRLAQGWPEGQGPVSGQNTLQANTLVLHLTWLHEPLLPGMKQVLKQIAPADSRYGSLAMAGAGYLPLQRQVALVMQSHPIAWELPAHGRVTRATHNTAAEADGAAARRAGETPAPYSTLVPDSSASQPAPAASELPNNSAAGAGNSPMGRPPCSGLWCLRDYLVEALLPGQNATADTDRLTPAENPAEASAERPAGDLHLEAEADDAGASTWPDVAEDCPGCCD